MLQLSKQIVAVSDDNGTGRFAPVSSLSEQEQSILRLFADGKNSAEIARTLGISLQTLRNHLHHVNEKLGTHSRLQAVMHAMHRTEPSLKCGRKPPKRLPETATLLGARGHAQLSWLQGRLSARLRCSHPRMPQSCRIFRRSSSKSMLRSSSVHIVEYCHCTILGTCCRLFSFL